MFYLLENSNICNLRCKSCPSRLKVRPQGFMSHETFKSIIDQSIEHNPKFVRERIVMHGYGNPWLNPDFEKNLQYLSDKGFVNVDFSDNCMLLTEERVRFLCSLKCMNYLKLSLNSSRKELMERINTGTDFDTVVEKIRMVCDIVKEMGSPFQIQVQLMHTSKNLDETPEEVKNLIQRDNFVVLECKIMSMLNMDKDNELLIEGYNFWDGNCQFFETSGMIQWDGDIVGCCVDNTKSQVIGNIRDGLWSEKIQSRIREMRSKFHNNDFSELPACARCEGKKK